MIARRWTEAARWGACFAFVLCFHAAGAMALLARWNADADAVANAPVVMIELAPLPAAPETTPNELPPGPQQAETKPEPEPQPEKPLEKFELPTAPQAELEIAPSKPAEKPKDKKPKQRRASLASAPSPAEHRAATAAAPAPGADSHNPNALPNWKSELAARLERYKRYPPDAQSRGEYGVAQLAFSVDRRGGVHNARIARSSGSSALDAETLSLAQRAAPMPPPPPEVTGAQITIMVPIRYNVR